MNWQDETVLVTGGDGFLGRHVTAALRARGVRRVHVPTSSVYDLVYRRAVVDLYADVKPTIVFHLAARVGGIGANAASPATFFYDNLIMGVQLMEIGRRAGLRKFITLGTVCAYPRDCPVPFKEADLWNGYPEPTNAPYGLAKKMLLVQSAAYRKQYDFNSIVLFPTNLYGPGDNFDPGTSHVIPALIRKCVEAREAKAEAVTVWGTGRASRDFLFVRDAAEAIVLAAERYDSSEPMNLGSGREIAVADLAGMIARLTGFCGALLFDHTNPDGQPRRVLDTTRARELLGWKATTPLDDGLRETIAWYEKERR